jgi:hypothetical protein
MLTHVVRHMASKEDVARLDKRLDDLRTEMIDQFEHADKQFRATHDRLRDMSAEITVIHRRVERSEELGASNAAFAQEIDHLLTRVAEIEKHLGIDKKIAPQRDGGEYRRGLTPHRAMKTFANHRTASPIVCPVCFPLLSG